MEIVRHAVLEVAFARHIHDARPIGHRLVVLALEGIELATDGVAAVTAGRRRGLQFLEVRQDQVENLRRLHFQHALAEEEFQRIAQLVMGHAQDAFIHREYHHPCRLGGVQPEGGGLARLDQLGHIQLQGVAARVDIDRERHHAKAQRAHENLVRRGIADILDIDIAVTLETGRHGDVLHRIGGLCREPGMGIDLVALDGDQPAAGIGARSETSTFSPGAKSGLLSLT